MKINLNRAAAIIVKIKDHIFFAFNSDNYSLCRRELVTDLIYVLYKTKHKGRFPLFNKKDSSIRARDLLRFGQISVSIKIFFTVKAISSRPSLF